MFKKRKVYIIQPALPEYRLALFDTLRKQFDLVVMCAEKDFLGVRSVDNIPYAKYSPGFKCWKGAYWSKNELFKLDYNQGDVVVINGNPRIIDYMLLFAFLKFKGIRVIWWGHGWSAGSHGLLSKIRLKIMSFADEILVYTDSEAEKLSFLGNISGLNNGLDSQLRLPSNEHALNLQKYKNKGNGFDYVFIGRVTEKSKLKLLLLALSLTKHCHRLHVIGSGPCIVEAQEYSRTIGLFERVIWHGSVYSECEIKEVMLSCHAFVYPGSVGLSLIHGFNYSLPAICHGNTSEQMPEFAAFKHNENGLSFYQNDQYDLASKLDSFYSMDVDDLISMSNSARETISVTYNVDDMVARFSRVLNRVKC